jgi:hypothetical protein
VGLTQLTDQLRQVLTRMTAHAQKQGHHPHTAVPGLHQRIHSLGQRRRHQLKESAMHSHIGLNALYFGGHGIDWRAPEGITRAVSKQDNGGY